MRTSQRTRALWAAAYSIALGGALACSRKIEEPTPHPAAAEPALEREPPAPAAEPQPAPAAQPKGPSEDFIGFPKPGWSKLKLHDTLPLCVFANVVERENAKQIDQVKKQVLKANQPVTFGAYGPYCINEACDDLPSLQCLVERDGRTLNVKARYIGYHKDGTTCTQDCREVYASCGTPKLEPGKYTVKYGEQTYTLKIPSVLRSPCFKTP